MLILRAPFDELARFTDYLIEILRLEGFADFTTLEFSGLDAAELMRHDLVILPRMSPSHAQMNMLQGYVEQGGALLAFQPEDQLAKRLGVASRHAAVHAGYLHLDAGQPVVEGLSAAPIQVVTPALSWTAEDGAGVVSLASIHPGRQRDGGGIPGVVWSRVGKGRAVLFAYDLLHTVARLRQGDPNNADLCFAGLDGIYRPSELFVGQMDVEQMRVPQADLHTALLARLIEALAPRPRLWYYPEAAQRSAVIMTSDDDWSSVEQFETLLAGLRRRQGHCTFYVVPATNLTCELMDAWEQEGHTFSVHPALESDLSRAPAATEGQRLQVVAMLRDNVARHNRQFGRTPRTIRQHAVRWLGYVDAARHLADLGIEMECNYISVHPFSLGYMAGSGRPLPFVDVDGRIIPCYQQPSLWTEEVLIHPEFVFSFKWTVARALEETGAIIRQAAREFYTPITFNSHPVSFATYSSPLIEGCWDAALAEGMPIVSADEWLDWTQARRGVSIQFAAGGFTLQTDRALAAVTLLSLEPVAEDDGIHVTQQQLWGRTYSAVTLRGLAAGEQCRVRYARTPGMITSVNEQVA